MIEYHKIHSPFKRGDDGKFTDEWSKPWFEVLRDIDWIATEKVDGMNMRVNTVDGFAGRTDAAVIPAELALVMVDIENRMKDQALDGLTLYGEGYGAGIQKGGGKYRPDKAFVLFDVLTDRGRWLERDEVNGIANQLGIPAVPLFPGTWFFSLDMEGIDSLVGRGSALHPGAESEGFVFRPRVELRDTYGERIITKLKFKDFK